ncbi:hypothetical protein NEF87_003402 [Candidatus Lokiarchaeum ossiferum]|uniref:PKD domain-containing protein n=1 Tax=Candidatus Lokiarchaeum ossiferum TaxID=2951803 RepID=A0ABY6HUA6_9ARCH|nr:hypothetical protein NEF87_003402 [Candidatus Lokiarchaeum sp. B-35]
MSKKDKFSYHSQIKFSIPILLLLGIICIQSYVIPINQALSYTEADGPFSKLIIEIERLQNSASHSPIKITGNDWSPYAILGNGSFGNPYIIANLTIDGGGDFEEAGIFIENSDVYGIIRNCTFVNIGVGVGLLNSGNCSIEQNRVNISQYSIYLDQSSNCTVIQNNLTYQGFGIYLDNSLNCSMINNNIRDSTGGIGIESSSECLIFNNYLYNSSGSGIVLNSGSTDVDVIQNSIVKSEYGIVGESSSFCTLIKNIIQDCSEYAIYIIQSSNYLLNRNNLTDNFVAGIVLWTSSNINVTDNNRIQNETNYGILVYDSNFCNIRNNYIENVLEDGTIIFLSSNISLIGNIFRSNSHNGVSLNNSLDCLIERNFFIHNSENGLGIDASSSNNQIRNNSFSKNDKEAINDFGTGNIFSENKFFTKISINFNSSSLYVRSGELFQLNCSYSEGYGPISFLWDFGDGGFSSLQNATHTYSMEDVYEVFLTVIEADGDVSIFTRYIFVYSEIPTETDTTTTSTTTTATTSTTSTTTTSSSTTVTTSSPETSSTVDSPSDSEQFDIPGYSIGLLLISVGFVVLIIRKKYLV